MSKNRKSWITPCFWYDGEAEKAAAFYCENFKEARITAESPVAVEFEVSGQPFICLNGGPQFRPNPSISFYYICQTREEMDAVWKAFEKGGNVLMPIDRYPWGERYGWIQDKYGVSWQFVLDDMAETGQKIIPCLMFSGDQCGRAKEAMEHYSSVFREYELDDILRYKSNEPPNKEGTIKRARFALDGQKFMVMDSADPHDFGFDEGVSLTIYCDTQDEIDYYWGKLTEGGQESMCGWLKDRFGVSWQVIPAVLGEIMSDPNKAQKAAQVFMEMKKFDIEQVIRASL